MLDLNDVNMAARQMHRLFIKHQTQRNKDMTGSTDGLAVGQQEIKGSEKPKNAPGQNGDPRSSSLLPNQKSRIDGFGPEETVPGRTPDGTSLWQTRDISADAYPTHPGMAAADANVKLNKPDAFAGRQPRVAATSGNASRDAINSDPMRKLR
jgi:hypothetical protein